MSDTEPDLSLCTFDDLAAEMEKRVTLLVIVAEYPVKVGDAQTETRYRFHGGYSAALGLLVRAKRHLLRCIN